LTDKQQPATVEPEITVPEFGGYTDVAKALAMAYPTPASVASRRSRVSRCTSGGSAVPGTVSPGSTR
jgi:hypothetical protein